MKVHISKEEELRTSLPSKTYSSKRAYKEFEKALKKYLKENQRTKENE